MGLNLQKLKKKKKKNSQISHFLREEKSFRLLRVKVSVLGPHTTPKNNLSTPGAYTSLPIFVSGLKSSL